jgi:amino acid transporter
MNAITAPSAPPRGFKRVLRRLDLTLFTVCAILVVDQLAASASIGTSAIFWWIFTLLLFFIPYGFMTAELASAYPEQGGIYAWVRRAFGRRWGARASWLYWVNVALWIPAVYLLFSGMLAQLLGIELGLWPQILIAIALTWATVYVNIVALEIGKWIPNIGALLKAVIMLTIGLAGIWHAMRYGVANDFSGTALLPKLSDGLGFLPVIVYSFLGFELMSGAAEEMKNPARDIPRTIVLSGALITAFYLFGTIGILIALPVDQISLVEGLVDTLEKLFGDSAMGRAVVLVLGFAALYTFFANLVTWTMGANRSIAEAAYRDDMPATLGKLHAEHRTPVSAAWITGVVATVVIIVYGSVAATAEDLFWQLFKFSSIIFLLPYLMMFPAFLRLRRVEPDHPRPYVVPGGRGGAITITGLCMLFVIQAIVLFFWVPGEPFLTIDTLTLVIGTALVLLIGEALIPRRKEIAE